MKLMKCFQQGFKDQIYKIFQYMHNDVQIGLFSATVPESLEQLTTRFMRNPIKILVKAEQLTLARYRTILHSS